jgi:hypothetical protein
VSALVLLAEQGVADELLERLVLETLPLVETDALIARPCRLLFQILRSLVQVVARMSSPFTVAIAVVGVTGARPSRPEVWASRKPPTNSTTMMIQMYFAEARIACSKGTTPYTR